MTDYGLQMNQCASFKEKKVDGNYTWPLAHKADVALATSRAENA